MVKALFNGQIVAQSDETEVIEGNHYFPPGSVNKEFLSQSQKHSTCPWKGEASYYDVKVDGKVSPDAAWFYPQPKDAASQIKDYVAFWKDVKVSD